ncbi:deoxycytidylate deaminase [Magnetococcus sp. PR-3]|uniref:deoxycytidylate deaminase n=1 Tax=Magnetococcus sp. PR-3 TaxID=3120355 RepID=UPI002FCE0B8F
MSRPSWDIHWMRVAKLAAEMSTCASGRRVGAVFVRDKRLLATGFNGVPSGYPHPPTCARREAGVPSGQGLELCVCAHAEANGIANAGRHGIKLEGCSVYVTTHPCGSCMGALANIGVKDVFYAEAYDDARSKSIAQYAGITLHHITHWDTDEEPSKTAPCSTC